MTISLLSVTSNGGGEFDIFASIFESQGVVLAVLLALILMSVVCWLIIVYKAIWFRTTRSAASRFLDKYWHMDNPNDLYEEARTQPHLQKREFCRRHQRTGRFPGRGTPRSGFENIERAVRREVGKKSCDLSDYSPSLHDRLRRTIHWAVRNSVGDHASLQRTCRYVRRGKPSHHGHTT